MTNESVSKVCERINKYLRENRLWADAYPYGNDMPVAEVEVSWGDWKHEHLRLKWLMEEIGAHFICSEVTEEDGSDTYSAVHRFLVNEEVLA